jgi:RimJ/RimL family protein N-acetyltransferase
MRKSGNRIHFAKATHSHKDIIFAWLDEPHVREFWDNSQGHRDDILSFLDASNYKGIFTYWIGFSESTPYCLLMTSTVTPEDHLPEVWKNHLSKTEKTFSIDFTIGNKTFLGKKLAAPTLRAFTSFVQEDVNQAVDLFMIDLAETNPRAKHVYEHAGFETVAEFVRDDGFFKDMKHFLMVKKLPYREYAIRSAKIRDINDIVALSCEKRRDYEKTQPQFWRHAEGAEEAQAKWFECLMSKGIGIFLVAKLQDRIVGFIRGQFQNAPEVYDPGGLTLMIDDFCVEKPDLWPTAGQQLLQELKVQAKQERASQVLVVSGHHDEPKRQFLKSQGLEIASEWFVGELP